jgi:hypothetical protein
MANKRSSGPMHVAGDTAMSGHSRPALVENAVVRFDLGDRDVR